MTKEERKEYNRQWRKKHLNYYKEWYHKNLDLIRKYQREYHRKWRKNNPDKFKKQQIQQKLWRLKFRKTWKQYKERYLNGHPKEIKKVIARRILNSSVITNKIKKDNCKKCGKDKTEGHHSNYNQPLNVIWLCKNHHAELHRK